MSNAASGDSDELEALFDSISSVPPEPVSPQVVQAPPVVPPVQAAATVGKVATAVNDSDELQALFDEMAVPPAVEAVPGIALEAESAEEDAWDGQGKVFNTIGQMARHLHDTLRELGYDRLIEKTVTDDIPDAKDRLAYIANLTEKAACKVLNATDIAQPIQDELEASAKGLGQRWDRLYANELSVEEFKQLAAETRDFLNSGVPQRVGAVNAQLMEIMMAQDFQDLTGQVIKKVVVLAQSLESQLMKVLIDVIPEQRKNDQKVTGLLNGPVINSDGRTDVVVSQQQVDDLLGSLGF